MKVTATKLPGVVVVKPRAFDDDRGRFMETYQRRRYAEVGIDCEFVQDNQSLSRSGVLRGLHYQIKHPQGKLVWAVHGEVFDVAVDLRRWSKSFGQWTGVVLTQENRRQLYVPPGLAHGYCVMSRQAQVVYKCTDYYFPQHERTLLWNDPQLAIGWPTQTPIVSEKDKQGLKLADAPRFERPPEPKAARAANEPAPLLTL